MWNFVSFNFCLRQGELSHLTQTFPGVHRAQKGGEEAEPRGFPISRGQQGSGGAWAAAEPRHEQGPNPAQSWSQI